MPSASASARAALAALRRRCACQSPCSRARRRACAATQRALPAALPAAAPARPSRRSTSRTFRQPPPSRLALGGYPRVLEGCSRVPRALREPSRARSIRSRLRAPAHAPHARTHAPHATEWWRGVLAVGPDQTSRPAESVRARERESGRRAEGGVGGCTGVTGRAGKPLARPHAHGRQSNYAPTLWWRRFRRRFRLAAVPADERAHGLQRACMRDVCDRGRRGKRRRIAEQRRDASRHGRGYRR